MTMSFQRKSSLPVIMCSNTEVYVRILPQVNSTLEYLKILDDMKNLYVRCWQDFAKGKENPMPSFMLFETNGIFYNVSQRYVFEHVTGNSLFDKLIYGNNALIMSYGQTGSGKSLTTVGLESTYEDRGLLPRIFEKLFDLKTQLTDKFKFCIKIQYVETNRNYMMDLLTDDDTMYDMSTYKAIVPIKVKDLNHGLKLLFKAEARKTVRNKGNYKSNMANCIATFSVFTKGHNTAVSEGTLHVIDLAGIDTIGNSSCAHKNGYEVGNGNLAKSQIEQLILVINENYSKSAELKQRLCIIIHYLRTVLNSSSLIRVIGHVRVQREDLKICTSMLRMGCSFKGMVPKKLSRFLETSVDVQLQVVADELKALKKEMDLNAMLCNEDMSCSLSDERMEYIQRLALEYLNGDNSELVLLSTTDTVMVMKVIKNVYQKLMEKTKQGLNGSFVVPELVDNKLRRSKFTEGSITSKASKNKMTSNHSLANGAKGKRATTKKVGPKQSLTTKSETVKEIGETSREKFSNSSLKSKTPSGKFGNRKRLSGDKSKLELQDSISKIPTELPSHTAAWNLYMNEQEVINSELNVNITMLDQELEGLTRSYNKEVYFLEELNNIANLRKNELNHAIMIKDIDTNPQTLEDLHEFQGYCMDLSNIADNNLLEQKEKILTLQAEMRLHLEHRAKLQDEVNKQFNEYCMHRFHVLIPEVGAEETSASKINEVNDMVLGDSQVGKIDYPTQSTQSIRNEKLFNLECANNELFNKLKLYMKSERARVLRKKIHNQRWIRSFKK